MRRPSPGGSCPAGRTPISVNAGDGACAAQIGKAPASQIRHTATGAQRSVLVLASSIVVAFLAAANAPSPLYERYETAWHASPLIGTIAFAAYAVAVIAGLLWLKELPALLGRRAVLLGAIAGQILALVLFAVAGSFALIVVGRMLQGLASGAALGTLSAAMVESDAERGTAASAASPGAGSGSGALLSGLVVQFLPGPRQTIYLILAAILAIQALFVLRVIPRGLRRPLSWKAVSPRVAVPADAKTTFMSTAPVVFAVWGLSGFYAALSPALYRALLRSKAAKLRVWRVCQGCLIGWRVEAVGAGAGAGEEPLPCPFTELGEHVAGFDAEQDGEVVAAPVARGTG